MAKSDKGGKKGGKKEKKNVPHGIAFIQAMMGGDTMESLVGIQKDLMLVTGGSGAVL